MPSTATTFAGDPCPVTTSRPGRFWQADTAAHALDRMQHLAGLSPRSVEQENMRAARIGGRGRRGGQRFAPGVEDPQLASMRERLRWNARGGEEAGLALVDVAVGASHNSGNELAGARRLVMLVVVDQHMDPELGIDRRDRVADAPPRRQAAAWAAGGTGENDTPTHA